MTRRNRDRNDQLARLLTQVQRRFADSPLPEVGRMLAATIADVQQSVQSEGASSNAGESVCAYVTCVLTSMPSSFGDRFAFDAQLIAALASECSQGKALLSSMLVPKPSAIWGHESIPMPSADRKTAHVINLIHIPGDDTLDDIDLLDYAFLCHELGHNILFRHGDPFVAAFGGQLDAVLGDLQRKSLGIRGAAKQVADTTANQLRTYWTPSADHCNWAHEIAVDVISLWLCGPAYLAAFQDVMEKEGLNPHQLGQSHPPYEVRSRALIAAAGQLGWAYYTGDIQGLIDRWSSSSSADGRSNLNIACADPRLIAAAVSAALETCRLLALPQCTPSRIDAVEAALNQDILPEFGIDLILASWKKATQTTEADFDRWEQSVIRQLLADITE